MKSLKESIFDEGIYTIEGEVISISKDNMIVKVLDEKIIVSDNNYREQYNIVVSRALASLQTVIEYSAPFLKNGGKIISYKGSNYEEEIKLFGNKSFIV